MWRRTRDGAEQDVQTALARSVHLRETRLVQAGSVRSFIGFALNNQATVAKRGFVALTKAQAKRARFHYNTVLKQVK